ncbi:hypothetical protein [Microcoleus sp. S11D4]|uniref:hypothetical protein n=2 Tax=unclassified Microcoleus TaxID=2642155 RepID=UPI002FD67636
MFQQTPPPIRPAMGTKPKFWFYHPELGRCLYKQSRPNTGEAWAEKIASELCGLLGLPSATIELAIWNSANGTVSPSFVPSTGTLSPGNDILAPIVPDYPRFQAFNVSQHTLNAVLDTISNSAVEQPLNWTPLGRYRHGSGHLCWIPNVRCLDW